MKGFFIEAYTPTYSIYEKNRNSNGRRRLKNPFKRRFDEIPTDLLRPNSWRMMMTMTEIMMK